MSASGKSKPGKVKNESTRLADAYSKIIEKCFSRDKWVQKSIMLSSCDNPISEYLFPLANVNGIKVPDKLLINVEEYATFLAKEISKMRRFLVPYKWAPEKKSDSEPDESPDSQDGLWVGSGDEEDASIEEKEHSEGKSTKTSDLIDVTEDGKFAFPPTEHYSSIREFNRGERVMFRTEVGSEVDLIGFLMNTLPDKKQMWVLNVSNGAHLSISPDNIKAKTGNEPYDCDDHANLPVTIKHLTKMQMPKHLLSPKQISDLVQLVFPNYNPEEHEDETTNLPIEPPGSPGKNLRSATKQGILFYWVSQCLTLCFCLCSFMQIIITSLSSLLP